jgi:acyl carrier protein
LKTLVKVLAVRNTHDLRAFMTAMELVKKILTKRGLNGNVTAATKLDELNADSLMLTEMTMEVEDELGIEIPDEDTESVKSIGDFIEVVQRHGGAKLSKEETIKTK